MLVGAKADHWGHKRLFLAALLILPIRGALDTLSDNPFWLVGVQLLDGVGAGIFGAIFPVIVADIMRTLAGFVVVGTGSGVAFLTLGAVAAIGAAICFLALPETLQTVDPAPHSRGKTSRAASAIAAE